MCHNLFNGSIFTFLSCNLQLRLKNSLNWIQETKTKTCCCNRWGSSTEDSTWYLVFVVKFVDLADITINNLNCRCAPACCNISVIMGIQRDFGLFWPSFLANEGRRWSVVSVMTEGAVRVRRGQWCWQPGDYMATFSILHIILGALYPDKAKTKTMMLRTWITLSSLPS